MRGFLTDPRAKLQFSGHETFPLRQLWLRKAYDAVAGHSPSAPRGIFADADAIARFGVGKNMVSAIRHWAVATDFVEERDDGYAATRLARTLFGPNGLDPYLEHPSTTWLIHWQLAGRGERSTTWYWAFNHLVQQSFDRGFIFSSLEQFVRERQLRVSDSTLKRDIECFVRCYVPKVGTELPEEMAESLLGELGLLYESSRGTFAFRRGPQSTLSDGVFAYALLDFWHRFDPNVSSLSYDLIAHEFGSPGRVFKLDENSVADRLMSLEAFTRGRLVWSDAAGLRQVTRIKEALSDLHGYKMKMLDKAYG